MALRKKTLAIPLTGPLERRNGGEDLTANLTALPAVPRALNVYRSRTGEWKQRPGHVEMPLDVAWLDEIVGGATVSGQLRLFGSAYQYAKSSDASGFTRLEGPQETRGRSAIGGRSSLLSSAPSFLAETTRCQAVDVAVGGGVMVVVTRNAQAFVGLPASSRLGYSAFRISDGSPLISSGSSVAIVGEDSFPGGLSRARVVYSAVQGKFVIVFTQPGVPSTAATTLTAFVCSAAGLASGAEFFTNVSGMGTNVATDLIGTATSANAHFDVMVEEDVGDLIIAYRGTGNNTRALRFRPSTAAVTTGPVTVVAGGDVAANSLAWVRADTWPQTVYRLLTAINGATGVVDRKITKATLLQSAALTVQASPGAVGSISGYMDSGVDGSATSGIHAIWDVTNAAPSRSCLWTGTLSTTWSAGEHPYGVSLRLHGHPFVVCPTSTNTFERWAVPLCSSITDAGKLFVASFDSNGFVREHLFTALDGKADTAPISSGNLGDVASYGGEFYYGVAEWLARAGDPSLPATSEEAYVKRARVLKFKFDGNRANPINLDANMALIPGSSWTKSNGTMVSAGPWPDAQIGPPTSVTGVAAGGPLALGDYYYTTLPVVYDDAGRRWAGIPSLPVKGTLTGVQNGFNVTMTDPLHYNEMVVVEAYRTKLNGTQSFRWATFSKLNQGFGSGTFVTDVMADSDLEKGLPLYTDSGELLHVPPPPSRIAWVAGQRILVVDSERPSDVWASSEFTPGEGPWFHPDVRVSVPGGEEIVAGAFMDGRSFLFTRKSIFALAGPWPGRTGAGQLPEVQRVATGVGGYSPESTVVTAEGIWFYSEDRGQCLLNRGLAVVPAGKIVDGVITSPPVAAIQVEKYDQVRFYMADRTVAVYDQVERQWSHWSFDTSATSGYPIKGAFVHNRDVYVFTFQKLLKEDAAAKNDRGYEFPVEMDLRIPIGPPGGKARIYRAILSGLVYGETKLSCTVFNDFGQVGSDEDTKLMIVKPRPGETLPALYEQTIKPKRGRCDSMLLRFSYLSSEGGLSFRALAVEVGGYQPATVARPGSSRQA